MLEETKDLLARVNNENKIKHIRRAKRTAQFIWWRKQTTKVFIVGVVLCFLIFPVHTGDIIGTWISDFFGTIYKNSIK